MLQRQVRVGKGPSIFPYGGGGGGAASGARLALRRVLWRALGLGGQVGSPSDRRQRLREEGAGGAGPPRSRGLLPRPGRAGGTPRRARPQAR